MDNIMIERLWRTVKYDDIYLKDYQTVEQLLAEVYFGTSVPDGAAEMSIVEQLYNEKEEPVYTLT